MIRCQTIDNRPQTIDLKKNIGKKISTSPPSFFLIFSLLSIVYSLWSPLGFAEMSFEAAEEKATEAHKLAASDVIYQEQDWKALYYQNLQMISLLKDIKGELETLNANSVKADQGSNSQATN